MRQSCRSFASSPVRHSCDTSLGVSPWPTDCCVERGELAEAPAAVEQRDQQVDDEAAEPEAAAADREPAAADPPAADVRDLAGVEPRAAPEPHRRVVPRPRGRETGPTCRPGFRCVAAATCCPSGIRPAGSDSAKLDLGDEPAAVARLARQVRRPFEPPGSTGLPHARLAGRRRDCTAAAHEFVRSSTSPLRTATMASAIAPAARTTLNIGFPPDCRDPAADGSGAVSAGAGPRLDPLFEGGGIVRPCRTPRTLLLFMAAALALIARSWPRRALHRRAERDAGRRAGLVSALGTRPAGSSTSSRPRSGFPRSCSPRRRPSRS